MLVQEFTTEELQSEIWLPVVGQESDYSVSSLGRLKRISACNASYAGRILHPRVTKRYLQISLGPVRYYVHHIVAAAFHGPRPEGREINHKDGDNFNNREQNLEYLTPRANMQHAVDNGLKAKGESHGFAIATEEVVRQIRTLYRRYDPEVNAVALSRKYGLHFNTVYAILKQKTWRHI
jgi:hypothetical protein